MTYKKGFTLIEVVIASLVILIVLGAMAIAVSTFVRSQKINGDRQINLVITQACLDSIDTACNGFPETVILEKTGCFYGKNYITVGEIVEISPGCRELRVSTYAEDSEASEVMLMRRYYSLSECEDVYGNRF